MGEIIFHILLALVLGVFYNQTFDINTKRVVDTIGPAGFPRAIIILAFILLAISLYKALKKYKNRDDKGSRKIDELNVAFIGILASIILFVLLVNYLGFILTSLIFLVVILYILGEKSIVRIGLYASITSVVFTLLFGRILSVPLPRGLEALKAISFIFY